MNFQPNSLRKLNWVEYQCWLEIKKRCHNITNKSYPYYGGRGIKICDRWHKSGVFKNFIDDMGKKPTSSHTIERKDSDGNYCPENCKWATRAEQSKNRRTVVKVTINGITKNAVDWCEEFKLPRTLIYQRIKLGMTGERLLNPSQKNNK